MCRKISSLGTAAAAAAAAEAAAAAAEAARSKSFAQRTRINETLMEEGRKRAAVSVKRGWRGGDVSYPKRAAAAASSSPSPTAMNAGCC